jgi:hypothetical protein
MRYLIVIAPNANNFDMNLSSRNGVTIDSRHNSM